MPKEKINIGYRIKHLFIYHPCLKLVAFIIAVIVWFYVRDEINKFNY